MNSFLDDFPSAISRVVAFDANITSHANAIVPGGAYADILSLAVRQTIANTELTVGQGTNGALNTSDVMLLMREGDNGDYEYALFGLNEEVC